MYSQIFRMSHDQFKFLVLPGWTFVERPRQGFAATLSESGESDCAQLFPHSRVRKSVGGVAIGTDLELMQRVREGDATSFERLLGRHRAPLVRFFYRMLQDPALAEDLAQEVFLRVYRSRERYLPKARFTTWLYRIATNLAWNALRDRKSEGGGGAVAVEKQFALSSCRRAGEDGIQLDALAIVADPAPTVEQRLITAEVETRIREAIRKLPEKQRAAVILHKYQELDYRRIAQVLNCSESALKSLLFRAYESLRKSLEPLIVNS